MAFGRKAKTIDTKAVDREMKEMEHFLGKLKAGTSRPLDHQGAAKAMVGHVEGLSKSRQKLMKLMK